MNLQGTLLARRTGTPRSNVQRLYDPVKH